MRQIPPNEPPRTELNDWYLRQLEYYAPKETYQTHRCLVRSLTNYFDADDIDIAKISADDVATFIRSEWDDIADATVEGKVSSLGSILGYLWGDAPAVARRKVAVALNDKLSDDSEWTVPTKTLTEDERILVEALRDWLRQHRYGSRLHAVVELILNTHARPSVVRTVDWDHVDDENRLVTVNLPNTHAVRKYDISMRRRVNLSPQTQKALKTYDRYYRATPADGDENAVFTSPFGRVSCSTLSRNCREASKQMNDSITHDELVERYNAADMGIIYQDVTLTQIRNYSLDTIAQTEQ